MYSTAHGNRPKPTIRLSKKPNAGPQERFACSSHFNYEYRRGVGATPRAAYEAWRNDRDPITLRRPFLQKLRKMLGI